MPPSLTAGIRATTRAAFAVLLASMPGCIAMLADNAQDAAVRAAAAAAACSDPEVQQAATNAKNAADAAAASVANVEKLTEDLRRDRLIADNAERAHQECLLRRQRAVEQQNAFCGGMNDSQRAVDDAPARIQSILADMSAQGCESGQSRIDASISFETCREMEADLAEARRDQQRASEDLAYYTAQCEPAARNQTEIFGECQVREAETTTARKKVEGTEQSLSDAQANVGRQERIAQENADTASRLAYEKCGWVPAEPLSGPPDGSYNQDIFGAQGRGLGGACSPGMRASCAAIQFQCTVSCGPPGAPTSCSPGAPAGCLACFAAGCI